MNSYEVLLQHKFLLHKSDNSTTRVFPFVVPRPGETLCLKLSFSPEFETDSEKNKKLILDAYRRDAPWLDETGWENDSPVSNLMTLSLDDPDGYRGNAHRKNAMGTYYVGEKTTSPGFLPGPVTPGDWRVSLHLHAVVTEECRATLEISLTDDI